MNVPELLQTMLKKGISDIHFKVGSPPSIRINGKLVSTGFESFTSKHIEEIAYGLLSKEQKEIFNAEDEIDMSYGLEGVSRFRVNIYRQRGTVALTLRVVPLKVKTFEELNLPANILKKLAEEPRGLILFAGITGAGKTTTMNAVLDYINENFAYKIVTIEDPIEYFHKDKKSFISQREVGADTKSFGRGLKYVLRQDPDVVCIGEMRDFEAISAGLTAAETGHLVLSTIHTMDTVQTMDRIVDAYPPHQQHQVRIALANVVKGIIAQRLIPTIKGDVRIPATEILIGTSLIRKNISEGKSSEIYKLMEQGEYYGMRTFDNDIIKLYKDKIITLEDALENATNPDDLMLKIKGIDRDEK
ncbi:MAG TPA: type IV pili twitching motility protein PilT [Elusimicrobia bacterium]|nr:type IV pili twitching motility protein PilT [Elusimicrobiota bacterium]